MNLIKGYWEVPVTERVKEMSEFVTMDNLYLYKVLPFGMKSSSSTYQRLVNQPGIVFCKNYSTPLTDLLSEKVKFMWSAQADEAFRKLKQILVKLSNEKNGVLSLLTAIETTCPETIISE
ncbi:uncharacterized protein LOC134778436 [Penaeus indicus]|uniref:uncharacterized protein LOC134778436 n=1 Tax=Penaeus indicus TaxID=29960 RepID=UPI00300D37E5